jgi:hypothetical protein
MLFQPSTLSKEKYSFGLYALNRSIIVAALALPIPKFIIVIPSAEAFGILPSNPK